MPGAATLATTPATAPAVRSPAGFLGLALLIVIAAAWLAYRLAHDAALGELEARGSARIDYHARELDGALEKFEHLPYLIGIETTLVELLYSPSETVRVNAANRYLGFVQSRSGIAAAYLMDAGGTTLASSNWDQATSFVGHNYAFRPYVQEALSGRTGRFYGVGVTTGQPGAFIAAPIAVGADVIGVAAIKLSLSGIEAGWRQSGENLAVADGGGVIFLASEETRRYRTLEALPAAMRERLRHTRQYGDAVFEVLAPGPQELLQARPLGRLGWRLLLFSDRRAAIRQGLVVAAIAGLAAALVLAALGLGWQHRRGLAERIAAQRELARISAELEQGIATRTAELTAANELLRATQDAAIQTGKLAVLGQMAAGISHELAQPLTALSTLADNAATFLARQDPATASDNLSRIGALCRHMGSIVGQLKAFARKEAATLRAVPLSRVIADTLMLIEPRRRESATLIEADAAAPDLAVIADLVRLEQVLVNLVRNGIDAMEDSAVRRVEIRLAADAASVTIAIRDHGPGLDAAAQAHLFEPFFTTKPSGKGLGLGLALSRAIVTEMNATLSARNVEPGAVFELRLPRGHLADHERPAD
ncbi:MAG: ATP-binding protein [Sulfuritalea sp.]|nr:ATP-binding protein [Sulfuritalea sp.]